MLPYFNTITTLTVKNIKQRNQNIERKKLIHLKAVRNKALLKTRQQSTSKTCQMIGKPKDEANPQVGKKLQAKFDYNI